MSKKHSGKCPTYRRCLCTYKPAYTHYECCGWYCACGGHVESPESNEEAKLERRTRPKGSPT